MPDTVYVKPATDVKVRDPERGYQHVPATGASVPRNAYWLRRIKDRSVIITDAPKAAAKTTTQAEAK